MPGRRSDNWIAYQIRIQGFLDETWADWFEGRTIAIESSSVGSGLTTLTTTPLDQSALRGILCRLWDLNMTLISVDPLE